MVLDKSASLRKEVKKNKDGFHVVYLGENGFPVGFGAIQKLILISKALMEEGAKVTVVNRKGKFSPEEKRDLPVDGIFEGIHYTYTAGSIYRPNGFVARNIQKLKGSFNEFQYLKKLKQQDDLDAAIISCYGFIHVVLYKFYSWRLNIPIVYNYVEMARVLDSRRRLFTRINDYLFERFLIPTMDGAFPISEVLVKQYEKLAPAKKMLKVPIICEFDKFDIEVEKPVREYFAYCGALAYKEVIDFVLESYDLLPKESPVDMHLILGGGTKAEYKTLLEYIKTLKKGEQVKVFHNVNHADIPKHYRHASALLIPLRDTLQDAARFPHKIGEYVASGNPMISTNFGEVACYFKDGDTGLIANEYSRTAFAKKMQFVLDQPEEAAAIGKRGKTLGLQVFNHFNYGSRILDFLKSLKK